MRYVKWVIIGLFWLCVAAFLHYTLPQRDIVRIVNTYEERQELNDWTRIFWSRPDDQSATIINRDVQFIQGVTPEGRPKVYRNEDTSWSWPPYFKFDTANLYTEANDAISTKDTPEWVAITHYGWRNEFLSIFPNAVAIKPVAGPDVRLIPWFNIIVLTLLAALVWAIWVRWRRFRQRRIDPVIEDVEDSLYAAGEAIEERRGRLRRWLDSWKSK
ncbi:DUF1523 family protein [Ruegeria pomeroyi]|jgi:hypothetical protein|uniref:DUF1523 domain-containing protein n=2 Tax=Ruegeria pomeroyi TaxID=89184 RepID=Q5LN92_RUEPO|nr:DUF1523 family protein [Ruegeria pomeroyi]HCE71778.1 DUF1523 domain-containing protein [Ruegeria sp.]AAV96547.1 hypothetical protein SPO3320 [Ruegeria pomeroyi DSS-3]NVK96138.1 DUF1523 family protein [Ruegeria pomeroyi]NVL00982.1 DUF1523 family protein [Ruegeria pomeroyi]QWV10088.1 DUF1523 family protein [Ruegeria pomeroyi]